MDQKIGLELGLADVLSINLLKLADKEKNENLRILGSSIGFFQYYYFGKNIDSSIVRNQTWDISSDVLVFISGLLLWKENLTDKNILGVILGILGIYLISSS